MLSPALLSLLGNGNNRRLNCFGDFFFLFLFRVKEWGPGITFFETFAFVVPHSVTSDMRLVTGEIVVLLHVLSDVDTETFYRMACRGTLTLRRGKKEKKRKTPYPSINVTTQDWVKIFSSFSPTIVPQDHIPRTRWLFVIQSCTIHYFGGKVKVATSS